jgi:hypothetical protein
MDTDDGLFDDDTFGAADMTNMNGKHFFIESYKWTFRHVVSRIRQCGHSTPHCLQHELVVESARTPGRVLVVVDGRQWRRRL